jgi:hypothetical protein
MLAIRAWQCFDFRSHDLEVVIVVVRVKRDMKPPQ